MTGVQAAQLIIGLAEIVLRLVPSRERAECKRAVAQAFIASKLDALDEYAVKKARR